MYYRSLNSFPSSETHLPEQQANRTWRRVKTAGWLMQRSWGLTSGLPTFCPSKCQKTDLAWCTKGLLWRTGTGGRIFQVFRVFFHDTKQIQPLLYHFDTSILQKSCSISHYWPLTDCRCWTVSFILPFQRREETFFKFLSYFSSLSWHPLQLYQDEEWDPFSSTYSSRPVFLQKRKAESLCAISISWASNWKWNTNFMDAAWLCQGERKIKNRNCNSSSLLPCMSRN